VGLVEEPETNLKFRVKLSQGMALILILFFPSWLFPSLFPWFSTPFMHHSGFDAVRHELLIALYVRDDLVDPMCGNLQDTRLTKRSPELWFR